MCVRFGLLYETKEIRLLEKYTGHVKGHAQLEK